MAGLSEQLHKKLNVSFISEQKRKFLALNEVEVADLPFTGNLSNHQVEGRYRRWNIGDNYQLLFDGYVDNKYETDKVITLIENLQELTPKLPKLENIGQTWMLSGWLESGTDADAEELVTEAYKRLFKKDAVPLEKESGEFLGGKVTEFGAIRLRIICNCW